MLGANWYWARTRRSVRAVIISRSRARSVNLMVATGASPLLPPFLSEPLSPLYYVMVRFWMYALLASGKRSLRKAQCASQSWRV